MIIALYLEDELLPVDLSAGSLPSISLAARTAPSSGSSFSKHFRTGVEGKMGFHFPPDFPPQWSREVPLNPLTLLYFY